MVVGKLVKRNILIYARDRAAIFFSLLSTLIVLVLMTIFLGNMNVDSTLNVIANRDEVNISNVRLIITLWTMGGIIVVNAVSISMSMIGLRVKDDDRKRLDSFLVTPVKRGTLTLGYILAANVVAFAMCVLTVIIVQIYIFILYGAVLSIFVLLQLLLFIIVNVFSASAMTFLVACFIKSESAFGGFTTIIGTLVGFFAAIYIPYGSMPGIMQKVLNFIPIFHGSSCIRDLLTKKYITDVFSKTDINYTNGYKKHMGISIFINNHEVSMYEKVLYIFAIGIVFMFISIVIVNRKQSKNK